LISEDVQPVDYDGDFARLPGRGQRFGRRPGRVQPGTPRVDVMAVVRWALASLQA